MATLLIEILIGASVYILYNLIGFIVVKYFFAVMVGCVDWLQGFDSFQCDYSDVVFEGPEGHWILILWPFWLCVITITLVYSLIIGGVRVIKYCVK